MRTKLSLFAAAIALVFVAGTAQADTVNIIWQTSGTATTTAGPSQTITANVVLDHTSNTISAYVFSISWDAELAHTASSCVQWPGTTLGCALDDPSANTAGSPGFQSSWGSSDLIAGNILATGVNTVGTITFHVIGSTGTGVSVGSFLNPTAGDNCYTTGFSYCTGGFVFNQATVNLIPEPGTVALISMGLAGLGLLGRRSRKS